MEKRTVLRLYCLLTLVGLLQACGTPDIFVEEQRFFEKEIKGKPAFEPQFYQQEDFKLSYVRTGTATEVAVVFLHGTPGGWDNGARYVSDPDLQKVAHVVSLDRPGWGGSVLEKVESLGRFAEQERRIKPLLEQLNRENKGRGVILVGHSLGASLAPYLAMQNPQLVSGLILLAGSLDPELGGPRWYNRAASMGVVGWFLSDDLRRANIEIMRLRAQLKQMIPAWPEITIPVTVIQGLDDELVYPQNVDFAERALINADLKIMRLAGSSHFIPWEKRDVVKGEILSMLKKLTGDQQAE